LHLRNLVVEYRNIGWVSDDDTDGNLTQDNAWDYQYDAENRLTTLTFTYDYTGRRAKKEVQTWDDQGQVFVAETRKFLYDGWLLVAEIKDVGDVPCLDRAYAWGPDLSGSLEGAGGIGGLVSVTQYGNNITTYLPAYDGNGNVMAMVRADMGSVEAHYDYSPFGQCLTSTGSYAQENPFRFSTKYQDSETGLLYFGYRYYNADTGRWINRDPIQEFGGMNLYGYVENGPVTFYDYLGLECCKNCCHKVGDRFNHRVQTVTLRDTGARFDPKTVDDAKMAANAVGQLIDFYSKPKDNAPCPELLKPGKWILKNIDGVLDGKDKPVFQRNGIRIYIKVTWDECREEGCWWSLWQYKVKVRAKAVGNYWHACKAAGKDPPLDVGFRWEDKEGIERAIPGCEAEALREAQRKR
jgi:RHS repeat-associated protein